MFVTAEFESTRHTAPTDPVRRTATQSDVRERGDPLRRLVFAAKPGIDAAPAIRLAATLGERHRATVEVIVPFEPSLPYPGASAPDAMTRFIPYDRMLVEQHLAAARRQLVAAGPMTRTWPVRLAVGQAPLAIDRAARQREADLVIVPMSEHAPRAPHAEREEIGLVLYASLPVLAVRARTRPEIRRMLIAIDDDDLSVEAARFAARLLPGVERVGLVHIVSGEDDDRVAAWRTIELVERAMELPSSVRIDRGMLSRERPPRAIAALARQHRADLIVCGLSGRTVEERMLIDHMALSLLREARTSMLIVPERVVGS